MRMFAFLTKKILLKAILYPFLYLCYGISFCSPRSNTRWVFGSRGGNGFTDNPKYLFLYVAHHSKDIAPIWITQNERLASELQRKGYRAYYFRSLRGIYSCLRANFFIFDSSLTSINFWLSGGAKKINLWHGIPLKKLQYDNRNGKRNIIYNSKGIKKIIVDFFYPWVLDGSKMDLFCVNSEVFQPVYASAFHISKNKLPITGLPRNDVLFRDVEGSVDELNDLYREQIKKLHEEKKKIVVYMPTFRDDESNHFDDAGVNLPILNDFLERQNIVLWAKFHPSLRTPEMSDYENIKILSTAIDIYPLLKYFDALITDYSSIYFDFLLVDKPILFFPYDFKKYISTDRELYFDYNEWTPGEKVYTFDELLSGIDELFSEVNETYTEERSKISNLAFLNRDGNSSERVYGEIIARFLT